MCVVPETNRVRVSGKTSFRQNRSISSQNVQLVPIKKMITHALWFHPQIKELLTLLQDKIAV